MVYTILQRCSNKSANVLDIGAGSGCIPISLKLERQALRIESIDVSKGAIKIAIENARKLGADILFSEIDFLDERLWERWQSLDVIVSNPPYVGHDEGHLMSEIAQKYEPDLALYAEGADPLIFYKKIAKFGKMKLDKDGMIFMELNEFKALEIESIFKAAGYHNIEILEDLQGKQRILIASIKEY